MKHFGTYLLPLIVLLVAACGGDGDGQSDTGGIAISRADSPSPVNLEDATARRAVAEQISITNVHPPTVLHAEAKVEPGRFDTNGITQALRDPLASPLGGTLSLEIFQEMRDSDSCTLEARFFVEGDTDAEILIYEIGHGSRVPVLPRDVQSKFPQIPHPRADWFEVIEAGETWTHECGKFTVIPSNKRVALEFTTGNPVRSSYDSGWLEGGVHLPIPDITFPANPIEWKNPPETDRQRDRLLASWAVRIR